MATPKIVTDGVDEFEEAVVNKYVSSDGTALQVKIWHGNIHYTGSATQLKTGVSAAGLTNGGIAFDGGDTAVDITLSGFTNPPVVVANAFGATSYYPKAIVVTNVLATIAFYDIDTGAAIVTGIEDTDMDFNIMIIGD